MGGKLWLPCDPEGSGTSRRPTRISTHSRPLRASRPDAILVVFPVHKEDKSQAQPKRKQRTEDRCTVTRLKTPLLNRLNTKLSTKELQDTSRDAAQSPSASESANFSSHLTSNGLSLAESSSILCESSLSVGTLLVMVSCSVS